MTRDEFERVRAEFAYVAARHILHRDVRVESVAELAQKYVQAMDLFSDDAAGPTREQLLEACDRMGNRLNAVLGACDQMEERLNRIQKVLAGAKETPPYDVDFFAGKATGTKCATCLDSGLVPVSDVKRCPAGCSLPPAKAAEGGGR